MAGTIQAGTITDGTNSGYADPAEMNIVVVGG